MFEIGSSLRQARRHRRLELADVERSTHIRVRYLAALEEERFDVLPSPAYVRGFLRTYAEFVGLDGGLLVDEYNERFAPPEEELQPIAPSPIRRGGGEALRRATVLLVAGAAATAVVWQLGFSSSEPQPVTTSFGEATAAPKPKPTRHAAVQPKRPATLVVRAARGPCWVQVRFGSAAGELVAERTLEAGGTLRFGLDRRLWVRLGAPWTVDVLLRGKRVGGLDGREPVNLTAA